MRFVAQICKTLKIQFGETQVKIIQQNLNNSNGMNTDGEPRILHFGLRLSFFHVALDQLGRSRYNMVKMRQVMNA